MDVLACTCSGCECYYTGICCMMLQASNVIDSDVSWVCLHGDLGLCLYHGCVAGVSLAFNCLCDIADSVVHMVRGLRLPCSRSKQTVPCTCMCTHTFTQLSHLFYYTISHSHSYTRSFTLSHLHTKSECSMEHTFCIALW